jgi:hypothetical protein
MTDDMADVLRAIADGRWRTIDGLAASLGWPRRSVEEAIEQLRLAYEPVIGGNTGVRLSDSPLEVRAYAQDRRRRLISIAKGTRALLTTARRMEAAEAAKVGLTLWDTAA